MVPDILANLCHKEGNLVPKNECRALMINHLILEEGRDILEAEDLADQAIRELDLWEPKLAELKKWLSENPDQT